MRFSLATATCAGVIAALLAGCSSSQQASQSLPLGAAPQSGHAVAQPLQLKGHKISPLELLKMQAAGKLPGPAPMRSLKYQLHRLESAARPNFGHVLPNKKSKIVAWTDDTEYDYIISLNKKFAPVGDINTSSNGCYEPVTLKVDHSGNLWTACESDPSDGPAQQEYSKTGTLENTYNGAIPCDYSTGCEFSFAEGFDGASNATNVFQSITFFEQENCERYYPYTCSFVEGAGYEYWPAGTTTSPTFVNLGDCAPICDMYYMDVDKNGNLWFDFYGETSISAGYGIGEIQNPTSGSPTLTIVEPPGTLEFAGGVYTSNGGSTLNVTDQDTRTTTQYSINGSGLIETGTVGPTGINLEGLGDPVSGGFNAAETTMGFGDAYGWTDTCVGATCKIHASADYPDGAQGFAFGTSDK
jgi:hypothetical protein